MKPGNGWQLQKLVSDFKMGVVKEFWTPTKKAATKKAMKEMKTEKSMKKAMTKKAATKKAMKAMKTEKAMKKTI